MPEKCAREAGTPDTKMSETAIVISFLQVLILEGIISEGHAHFMLYFYSSRTVTIEDIDRVTRAQLSREYPEGLWRTGESIEPLTPQQAQQFTSTVSAYSIDRYIARINGDAGHSVQLFCS